MFTLKHEEPDGYERIVEVAKVWRDPHPPGCIAPNRPLCAYAVGETYPDAYSTGRVFLMNAAGKTVATYVFNWPPEAQPVS